MMMIMGKVCYVENLHKFYEKKNTYLCCVSSGVFAYLLPAYNWQFTPISRQYQFDYNLFDLFKKPIKIMTQFMLNSAVNIIISNLWHEPPHWEAMTCAEIDEIVIILLKYLQATHHLSTQLSPWSVECLLNPWRQINTYQMCNIRAMVKPSSLAFVLSVRFTNIDINYSQLGGVEQRRS